MLDMAPRVALVCIDPWSGAADFQPFNFGSRRVQAGLAAYAPEVEVHYVERDARATPDDLLAELVRLAPDVVGMSAYVWSFARMLDVARELGRLLPETLVVMGGPSARTAMFELEPYRERRLELDALVLGEGERTFARLVREVGRVGPSRTTRRAALTSVAGLALPTRDGFFTTPPAPFIAPLDDVASPYQLGLVPPGVNGHLETFRGCPLSCSFCQWGATEVGSRVFSAEYLTRELRALERSTHRSATLVDAALNLSPRAFRNLVAAEDETGVLARLGLGFELYPTHLTDEHLRFLERIRIATIGVGLQSYDKAVLKTLQRPFDEARFERVVRELSTFDTTVVVELIMGLPHDGPASFWKTFERALALPCHVRVFKCLVLPDALLTRAPAGSELEFDPRTLEVRSCRGWTSRQLEETSTMLDGLSNRILCHGDGEGVWFFEGALSQAQRAAHARREQRGAQAPGPVAPLVPAPDPVEVPPRVDVLGRDAVAKLDAALERATRGALRLRGAERSLGRTTVELEVGREPVTLDLDEHARTRSAPAFAVVVGVAVRHRGRPSEDAMRLLAAAVPRLGPLLRQLVGTDAASTGETSTGETSTGAARSSATSIDTSVGTRQATGRRALPLFDSPAIDSPPLDAEPSPSRR